MSRWWRAYDEALNDPKVQGLPPALFKFWFNLLCVASKNDGVIPPLSELKATLKARLDHVQQHVQDLLERGLIDNIDGRLEPHNWRKRQYKSDNSTPRVQAHRGAKRNVSETPPENRIQNTETDKKDTSLRSASDWPSDYRERFWETYPRKAGKAAALRKLDQIKKSGLVTWAVLMLGVGRYSTHAANIEPRFVKHPATWLNAGCWDDQLPATATFRGGAPPGRPMTAIELEMELAQWSATP